MLCNASTGASLLLHRLSRLLPSTTNIYARHASSSLRAVEHAQPTPPPTPAQLSRAAAQAVRHCCSTGELRNAFYIVNSLRCNQSRHRGDTEQPRGLHNLVPGFDAIEFEQRVNPRLSYHALLHGLLKQGFPSKATQLATLLIQDGTTLRTRTLGSLASALADASSSSSGNHSKSPLSVREGHYQHPSILSLESAMIENEHLAHGISLVQQARRYRQKRTRDMFQALISACLLQGEIIVGSLLFVLLVKDWETRRALALRLGISPNTQEQIPPEQAEHFAEFKYLYSESIFPPKALMNDILAIIDATLSREDVDETSLVSSLQALTNIAVLLDKQSLPFPEVAVLVRTMYRIPRVDHKVWVDRGQGPERVAAYVYIHQVLKRLIDNLPTNRPAAVHSVSWKNNRPAPTRDPESVKLLPPLDLASYNSLLHYALRHRLSTLLAEKVLAHMTKERYKPLDFDITTFNILIRSGTLMRNSRITQDALQGLRQRKENEHTAIMVLREHADTRSWDHPGPIMGSSRFSKAQRRSQSHPPFSDPAHLASSRNLLLADSHTLSSYITHLVSTGQPDVVRKVLFHLLPELAVVDHPTWGALSAEERTALLRANEKQSVRRAVSFGPYTFTTLLNALRKTGETGLAERVWLLAKRAERMSWDQEYADRFRPWCLPVEAYTTMIQCYAEEARRGSSPHGVLRLEDRLSEYPEWTPKDKRYVVGWARFVALSKAFRGKRHLERGDTGRMLGLLLFRSMLTAAHEVFSALMDIAKTHTIPHGDAQVPKPDARFFNAALTLFARLGKSRSRRSCVGPAHVRRQLVWAHRWYARYGHLPRQWDPVVQEICEAMIKAGYSIPPGLRYLFVGRWKTGCSPHENRVGLLDRRPFAFPRARTTFHPYSLHTNKTRGLPLGRLRPRRPVRTDW
ncbi:hypothetical protein HGRIS_009156 [Hohenbuehelia grisea]|uniref:Uncharacterized protein n=1 Tax=Hohenbuehelia grisea TaxID=104357 RepID=A0ABR3J088_9AGAR